jgi:hypothetical protein
MSALAVLQSPRRTGNFGLYGLGAYISVGDADAPLADTEGQGHHRDVIFLAEGLRSLGDLVSGQ